MAHEAIGSHQGPITTLAVMERFIGRVGTELFRRRMEQSVIADWMNHRLAIAPISSFHLDLVGIMKRSVLHWRHLLKT